MRDRDVDQVVYKWWVERLRTRSEGACIIHELIALVRLSSIILT